MTVRMQRAGRSVSWQYVLGAAAGFGLATGGTLFAGRLVHRRQRRAGHVQRRHPGPGWRHIGVGRAARVVRFAAIDVAAVKALCEAALADIDDAWLEPAGVRAVLAAAGIQQPNSAVVRSGAAAGVAFRALQVRRAVLKIVAEGVQHKTEVDGIRRGVTSAHAAAAAFRDIRAAAIGHGIGDRFHGVVVDEEVEAGIECLIGVTSDPVFGPLVAFGTGGIETELAADVAFRITPVTDTDADELLAAPRVRRRLDGFRGRPGGDLAAVRDVLLRIAFVADEVPLLAELDINPLIALEPGRSAVAVDARIRVSRAAGGGPPG